MSPRTALQLHLNWLKPTNLEQVANEAGKRLSLNLKVVCFEGGLEVCCVCSKACSQFSTRHYEHCLRRYDTATGYMFVQGGNDHVVAVTLPAKTRC